MSDADYGNKHEGFFENKMLKSNQILETDCHLAVQTFL